MRHSFRETSVWRKHRLTDCRLTYTMRNQQEPKAIACWQKEVMEREDNINGSKKRRIGEKDLIPLLPIRLAQGELRAVRPSADGQSEKATDGVMVNINKVEPNRDQPRKNFDEDALVELSESIRQFGVLQPLLVQDKKRLL